VRKTGRQAWSCLNSGISSFTAVVSELESKDCLESIEIDMSLKPADVGVQISHIFAVKADKCLFWIEAKS
jgi:hypothetical protein